jgi:thioredoxin reductase (NADPH)
MSAYDVLIIGAGPIGLACGIAAKKAGLQLCNY